MEAIGQAPRANVYRSSPVGTPALARLARGLAAMLPAIVISWSALIDPLINFDLAAGMTFGGVELESESKTRTITQLVMPLFFALAALCALVARPVVPRALVRVALPAVVLLLLGCVSALWSRSASQTLTLSLYQSILVGSVLLSVAVAADSKRVLRFVLLAFAASVAANLATVILRPPGEIGHLGIYSYKNTLGSAGACAFLFGLFHLTDRHPLWRLLAWFTTAGAVVITLASDSKTALALMVVAPFFAVVFHVFSSTLGLKPLLAALLFTVLGTGVVLLLAGVLSAGTDDFLLATYGDTTFTGRTEIWDFMMPFIQERPWFGNGYRGFWSLGEASPRYSSEIEFIRTIGSGHSGYFDITLSLGLVGLALMVLFVGFAFSTAGRLDMRATARTLLYVSVIMFVIGRNAMESVILWSTFFDNLSFLLVAFLSCYREVPRRRARLARSWSGSRSA